MVAPFVIPQGGAFKDGQGGNAIATITTSPTVTPLGGGIFKLEWTGTVPNNVIVPTGGQLALANPRAGERRQEAIGLPSSLVVSH